MPLPLEGATRPIKIVGAVQDGDDGILVSFSDGTVAGYVIEELLDLRPEREHFRKT